VGDLVAKHPDVAQSLETVKYAREIGAHVVRGNHDEAVIEWRGLIDKHSSSLENGDDSWLDSDSPPDDLVLPLIKGKWKGEHFEIARRLPRKDYEWLLGLPLTLHVNSLHTYFVHAGLLPEPESRKHRQRREKDIEDLSLERSTDPTEFIPEPPIESHLAKSLERSVLLVEQNRRPYNLLNMRGVRKNGRPTKNGKKGTPCKCTCALSLKFPLFCGREKAQG
jgi:hypothetical protein